MKTTIRWTAVLVLAGALAAGSEARAQAIRGHLVDDELLVPVSGATITVLIGEQRGRQVPTRNDGSFFIPLDSWGGFRLEAERIGYGTTTSQAFRVDRGDTVSVEFRILADAVLMEPLLVTARSNRGQNVFYRRMTDWGQGIFVTPEMVDSIGPRHPADVLHNQEKVWLSWGWGAGGSGQHGPIPNIRTFMGSGCVGYLLDGRPVIRPRWARGSMWLDYPFDTLFGDDIVAVEIYRHISEVPPDIRNAANEVFNGEPAPGVARIDGTTADRVQQDFMAGTCGLVNFWTRVGW